MQQVPRSMAAPAKKPAFLPLPILASVTFIVLAIGAQSGYIASSHPPASPPAMVPTDVASLQFLADAGALTSGPYTVADTIDNVTVIMGYMSNIRFGSSPGTGYTFAGNHSYLRKGDSVEVRFYYSESEGMLFPQSVARG